MKGVNSLRSPKRRRGFTLVELLVVLLILSILVAAVIPVVTQQGDAADAPRAASDLTGIRDGIAMFRVDVRKYPGDLEDLVNKIVAGTDSTIETGNYTNANVKRWKGPYLELATSITGPATGTAFTTGFDGAVQRDLTCYNPGFSNTGNANDCSAGDSTLFAAVKVLGLGLSGFNALNELIDGIADTLSSGDGDSTSGRLRRAGTGAGDTTFYLAAPSVRETAGIDS